MKKITLLFFAFITSIWSVNAQSLINITTSGGDYGSEKWVSITTEADGAGTQVWGQGDGSYGNEAGLINEDISIAPGTYYVNCYDKYDDDWDGTLIAVTSYSNTIGDNGGVSPNDDNDEDSSSAWETPAIELEASFVIVVPDPPSCFPVSGVTVAPVSGTDVTIAWTAGDSETGWSYEYGVTGFTQGDGTSGTTSTTSVDISGLTQGSVYDIYIQANCTGEDSTWVMVTFTMPIEGDNIVTAVPITPSAAGTGCDTVGFTLNFSSDGTTDSGLDGSCNNSNTGLDQFFTWTATTDALLFNDAEPGNPGIVVRDLAGNEISCAETFAADDSILSGWAIGDDLIIQIYDYGTSVSDVAFCLEEFSMPETPNCAENLSPTDGATNVAIPQAVISISWDAPATGVAPTGYEVFLGTTSGALNSLGDTEVTTVSITNLNYATTYYWKVVSKNGISVAADCSESSFTTQSASVPFISSFENYPSGWFEAAGAYGSPAGTTSTFAQGDFGNDTENANGKSAKVNIYGTSTDEYLVSPILDLSSGTHYLNFDLALTAYNVTTAATLGADDYLALLVTQDAGATWQELTRWDSDSTLGNTGDPIDEIELTGYGAEVQFAFYAFSDTSNVDNDLFIDNFQITAVSLAPVTEPTEAAPTPPARETADVVSLFSDAYTDVTLTELPTDWSDVTTFEATTVASDNVWKLSGLEFLGMVTNYDTGIDVSSMEKLHIDYWVPTGVENELLVKIVNTIDGGEDVESLGTTVAGSWQSIDLDMTGFDGGNLANTEKITQILIDAVDRATTVYVDNFYFYREPVVVTEPTEAAPTPPARETADVVSLFSDAYTDVTLTELPTDWSDVTTFEATTVASDNVWKLSGLEFLGMVTNYDTGIDVSSMEKLHIDYWVPTGVENELLVKIVNTIDGGEDVESLGTTVAGSWQSIDLDMTGFDGGNLANTEKITQILIDAVDRATTVYVDNFYFYREPVVVTEPTEAAPTPPARETADVVSLFSDAYTDVTLTELPTDWSDVTTFEATTVASDNVWKLSGLEFLGMVTNYDTGIDVSSMEKLHIDYWVPTGVENELLVKIVNTIDGGEDVESLGTTVAGSWQSIDLDMTGFDGGNLANTEKITQILIDAVDRATTVYVDNFYFYREPVVVTEPTEAAPTPPARETADVVSLFSDAYTDVTLTELPTDWSDVTTFEATTVASDNVWKLSGLEFLGMVTNYDTGIDVSSMEKLHIDYWVPTGVENELLVKIVNTIDGGEDVESLGTTVAGSWQSIDLDMTGFDGGNLANTEKITQILIDAVDRAATVYVDNFYFYKEPSTTSDIIFITELADPNDNAAARYVEIYNGGTSDVDLTGWTLRRYTNGNAEPQTTGEDLTPIGSLAPGAIAIIAANGTAFEAAFGMAADISAGSGGPADSNGDDQIYITDASDTIVDFFGVPGEDGSGTDHEFEDGRAERKASVTQGTATWDVNEWNIDNDAGAGDGALDVDGGFDPGVWIGADTAGVENESLVTLNMYPNPASDVLNISSQSTINTVEIFNVLGQKVITMQVEDTSAEINVSNLNAGIYLIKYDINNSTSTKKFVKN